MGFFSSSEDLGQFVIEVSPQKMHTHFGWWVDYCLEFQHIIWMFFEKIGYCYCKQRNDLHAFLSNSLSLKGLSTLGIQKKNKQT